MTPDHSYDDIYIAYFVLVVAVHSLILSLFPLFPLV